MSYETEGRECKKHATDYEAPICGITMSKWLFMHENFVQQPDDTLAGILFLK